MYLVSSKCIGCQMNFSNYNTQKWSFEYSILRYLKWRVNFKICGNNVVFQEAAAEKSRIPMCLVWVHKVSTKAQGNWIINILLWWQSRIQNMYFLCDNLYGWKQQTWKFNVTEYLPCYAEFGKPYYKFSPAVGTQRRFLSNVEHYKFVFKRCQD